jgi:hypothetical protein
MTLLMGSRKELSLAEMSPAGPRPDSAKEQRWLPGNSSLLGFNSGID